MSSPVPALPPPPTTHPSAMLPASRGLFGWLGRRAFQHVRIGDETVDRLRPLPDQGTLVYVMRTRSVLDYLFFNHVLLGIGLPLATLANGVNLDFYRGLITWVKSLWTRAKGSVPPAGSDAYARAAANGSATLLFMKAVSLKGARQSGPGVLEALIAQQRAQARPILLLPHHIAWPPNPPSKRRSWFDVLFGDQDASGWLRKLGHFFRYRKRASVQVGEPINLAQVVADHADWTDARIARKVRRVLFVHLAREAMAIHGPKVKPAAMIRQEILERARFRDELREVAEAEELPYSTAYDRSRRYLKEIAAAFHIEPILVIDKFLAWLFSRVFRGVEIDEAGMRRVKEAARLSRSAPLVLLPSHKSHLDYLVISWVFLRQDFIPPHVAAGANLNFFPVGGYLRRCGAFFLRRSFAGQPIYKFTFRRYLWKLVREGYPLEFYMEGGRSRTGKLLPPKMGMMSMLLEGVARGEYKDLQFVPINLSYERVVETGAYRRELTGGKKETESVAGVVKAGKVFRSRYGRIYVSFEKPVRLSEWLAKQGVTLRAVDDDEQRDTTKRLSYHLMRRIQLATIVSPSQLVGAVLMSHSRRGLSAGRLRERVGFLVDLLQRREVRLSRSIQHRLEANRATIAEAEARSARDGHRARGDALRPLLEEAMGLLKKLVQTVDRGGESIFLVPEKSRIELDYYRNAILSALAPEAIVATALLAAGRPVARNRVLGEVQRLSSWFRLEFIFETQQPLAAIFDETVDRLVSEGFVQVDDDGMCAASAPLTLQFMSGMLRHLVEGYWIAADALRGLAHGEMEKKDWLEYAREHGEREFLEGDVQRPEAVSTAVLGNALELFRQEGLVRRFDRGTGRKPVLVYGLARDRSLEDVAFRRDDLGFFLSRARETVVPAAQQPALDEPSRPPMSGERPSIMTDEAEIDALLGPLPIEAEPPVESEAEPAAPLEGEAAAEREDEAEVEAEKPAQPAEPDQA